MKRRKTVGMTNCMADCELSRVDAAITFDLMLNGLFKAIAEDNLGADPEAPSHNDQRVAPIHSAAASGVSAIVPELIEKGADVNSRQQGGYTALHAATQNRDLKTIRILVENGADCGARNDSGQTPKDFAERENMEEIHAILRACR
jgi:ankyrin repeat protein